MLRRLTSCCIIIIIIFRNWWFKCLTLRRCHLTKRSSKWCISAKGWLMQIDKSWSLNYVLHSAASIHKSPEVSVTWSKCVRHSFYILTSCGPCLSLLSVIPHLYSWSIRFIQYFVLVPPIVSSIILFYYIILIIFTMAWHKCTLYRWKLSRFDQVFWIERSLSCPMTHWCCHDV